MSNFINEYVDDKNPQLLKYKKFIVDNDWTISKSNDKESIKNRLIAFNTENDIVNGVVSRLKYFVNQIEPLRKTKKAYSFIQDALSIIDIHRHRESAYNNSIDISEIENVDFRADEITFQNHIFNQVSRIEEAVSKMNIPTEEEKTDTSSIVFRGGVKAPLSMHKVLKEIYPEIQKVLDDKGINFKSKPKQELHILNPKPPVWDSELHYWEQETATLQYYVDEFKKLEQGVVIDGVYISDWAYFHLNVFITNIPHSVWDENSQKYKNVDKTTNPPLRDSDWMIFENRVNQIKGDYKFMFLAATRRAAKTTAEASMLAHAATIGKRELLCAGASGKDLGQLSKNFQTHSEYVHPAFAIPNATNDWEKEVILGIKRMNNKTIILSVLNIINTDGGNNKEIFAGFTPDILVLDEAMKSLFLESLEGVIPAMAGIDGTIRCYGVISGTGGDESLSADGLKSLNDPETYDILPMNWEILERGIDKEQITWADEKMKPFGTFIPGQCRVDRPKKETNLADYLGVKSKYLSKVKMKVTDWEKAKKEIEEIRLNVISDPIKHQKEIVYNPLKPSEIFMSGKINPFPVNEAKAHKDHLLKTGKWDRRREIYKDSTGQIRLDISTRPLAEYPHRGGIIDAPVLIFEDPPKEKPRVGTYTAGFDDYASENSDSDSVSTFYIMKNEILGDPFSEKIVASISFRPDKHYKVHEKWYLLMQAYYLDNCCFGENVNYEIKTYLDRHHDSDRYLASSIDFSKQFNIANNMKRMTGWNPTTSKRMIFNLFVDYCNQDFDYEDEDGNMIRLKGVQKIDDIGLLDEIINWSENANVDRITGVMGAYAYIHYLKTSLFWRIRKKQEEGRIETKKKPIRQRGFYNTSSRQRKFL
jgi:hypothetical protein